MTQDELIACFAQLDQLEDTLKKEMNRYTKELHQRFAEAQKVHIKQIKKRLTAKELPYDTSN